mmetsp:Transcript_9005/g.16735  ORF Transcript_9005/g.16735 Transcript_9005/m.16735 type:complete len:84 (-) Transcript_9005:578-829(-)
MVLPQKMSQLTQGVDLNTTTQNGCVIGFKLKSRESSVLEPMSQQLLLTYKRENFIVLRSVRKEAMIPLRTRVRVLLSLCLILI